jgi:hypothetical protein
MIPQTRIGISQAEHVKAVEPDIGLGLLPIEPPNDAEPRAVLQLVNVADSGDRLAGILIQDDVGIAMIVHERWRKGIRLRSMCVLLSVFFKEHGGSSAVERGSRPSEEGNHAGETSSRTPSK